MKTGRHIKIMEIIKNNKIGTQHELRQALIDNGFDVTQATVSRDINDLKIVKKHLPEGGYAYAVAQLDDSIKSADRFSKLFNEAVISADYAENIIVIKSFPGMANAVCSLLDAMQIDDIVGTIAGDDTIFIVVRKKEEAEMIARDFNQRLEKY